MVHDHSSNNLPDDIRQELDPQEWDSPAGLLRLQCGHRVPVKPGDTVWVFMDDVDDEATYQPIYFAVDPVTLH